VTAGWVGYFPPTTPRFQEASALPRQAMSRNEYGTIAQAGRGLERAKIKHLL